MSQKRVTIRDVAAAAGVSKSLVSFVYADPNRVSKEKRELVLATAAELGFRPNWAARSLAASDGGFVGVLMADLHSPAFAEIVDGARSRLKENGRTPLMTSAHLVETDNVTALDPSAVTFFGDLRPQGLLIVGGVPDMSAVHALAETVPTVIAGASLDTMPSVATVRTDDVAGMAAAIRHLKELGHVDIAHVGGAGGRVSELRAQAYLDAMRAHGLHDHVCVAAADFSESTGYSAVSTLLDQGEQFTAVCAVSDYAAIGALAALSERGRTQVSVVGYGDTEVAGFAFIGLTTLRPGNTAIGERAAQELLDAESADGAGGWTVLLPPELVVRRTTHRLRT
ncbi:LacI family DNA-binding transcriptional regulator [Mycobacterium sp. NPDC003323]